MTSIRRMAWSLLKANRLQIATSVISIVLSIVLVTTMFLYGVGARQAMEQSLREKFGEADLLVSYFPEDPYVLTGETIRHLTALPEVEQSAEVLHAVLPLDEVGTTVFTVGVLSHSLTQSGYKFTSQVTPQSIILTRELARFLQVAEGDGVTLAGTRLTVAELIDDAGGVVELAIVHPMHVKPYLSPGERANGLMVKLAKDADALAVAATMKQLDGKLRIDLREGHETVVSNIRALQAFIAVLSVLVLAVSILLVLSNFESLLYKLRHQIAVLRSLGATTRQVGDIVRYQSLFITITATGLGALASWLGMDGLFRIAEGLFHLPPVAEQPPVPAVFAIAIVCGTVFQLFLLIPARRSTRILPVKLAEDMERLDFRGRKGTKKWRGRLPSAVGLFLYVAGYAFEQYAVLLLGILLFLGGSLLLVPSVAEALLKRWHRRIGRKWGRHLYLAVSTMLPQIRKNAFSVLSVSLVMIIAVFGSTLLNTLDANNHRYLHELYEEAPIYLYNRLSQTELDPYELKEDILRQPSIREVTFVSGMDRYEILIGDKEIPLNTAAAHSPLTAGLKDDELILAAKLAADLDLQPGDEVSLGYFDVERQKVLPLSDFRVARISHELTRPDEALVSWTSPLRKFPTFSRMYVETDNEEQALTELESVLAKHPQLTVHAYGKALEVAREGFLQRWAMFIAVLFVLVSATMAGVLHTFINNLLSKRKEYAVLRAVGVTPKGVLAIILSQAGFSLATGIAGGLAAGVALIVLVVLLDPTPIVPDVPVIVMTGFALLFLVLVALTLAGRRLTGENLSRELTMDGK